MHPGPFRPGIRLARYLANENDPIPLELGALHLAFGGICSIYWLRYRTCAFVVHLVLVIRFRRPHRRLKCPKSGVIVKALSSPAEGLFVSWMPVSLAVPIRMSLRQELNPRGSCHSQMVLNGLLLGLSELTPPTKCAMTLWVFAFVSPV